MSLKHWFVFAGLLLGGCGKVADDSTPDAPAADANLMDADERGNASIVTENELVGGTTGAPAPMIDVFSTLPNNHELGMTTTDGTGHGTIAVYPGGSVTAVYKHTVDAGADLITYMGVKPGDTLKFGSRNPSTANFATAMVGSMTVTWPAFPGAVDYLVYTSCDGEYSTATSTVITEYNYCHHDSFDILFVARNSAGVLLAYNSRSSVTFQAGGTVALSSWSSAQTGSVNITGVPTEFMQLSGSWGSVIDGQTEESPIVFFNGTPTGGAYTTTFPFHPGANRTIATVNFNRPSYATVRLFDSFSTNTLTETVAAPVFPPLQQSSVIASSALRMASWFFVPSANSVADAIVLRVSWTHTVNSMTSFYQWYFIMPPDELAIAFPKVPSALEMYAPSNTDSMGGQVRIFDVSTLNNYDAVRAQPSRNLMCLECAVRGGDFQRVIVSGGSVN